MRIELKRGGEIALIEADDELLVKSFAYSGIFERQVKLVTDGFYDKSVVQDKEAP